MTEKSPVIELKNLTKTYKNGVEFHALDNVSLRIDQGEFVAIVGPSGSGKSTLMHLIGLLDTPSSGTLLINRNDVTKCRIKNFPRQETGRLVLSSSIIICFRISKAWKI